MVIIATTTVLANQLSGRYLYTLSDFTGPIPFNWVGINVDRDRGETYVVDSGTKTVRIFNESGMEVYRFGDDGSLGTVTSVAVAGSGDIYLLARTNDSYSVSHCNFRGELLDKLTLKELPQQFATDFLPDTILAHDNHIYLVDRNFMKVAVTGPDGVFTTGYDLAAILGFDDKKRRDSGIVGFNLDRQGNMLFTVPVYFSAYIVSPDKKVQAFGNRGSSPGKFNVVSGIAADDNGNIYVTDTLRCVVMIFDKELNFRTEFGYRGLEPGNLIAPMELAVNNDRVYVAQTRSRGVSVYRVFAE